MNPAVENLRGRMRKEGIDYYLLGTSDPHNSEYVCESWRTLALCSGFSGSLAYLVVTQDFMGLWVDSRYHLQAERECDADSIEIFKIGQPGVPNLRTWFGEELARLKMPPCVGLDGRCFAYQQIKFLVAFQELGACSLEIGSILIENLWSAEVAGIPRRPPFPGTAVEDYPVCYAGMARERKIALLQARMRREGYDYYPVIGLDSIAWLLNIRAGDIPFNPVALSYLMVGLDGLDWYIEENRVPAPLRAELAGPRVSIKPYDAFYQDCKWLAAEGARFLFSEGQSSLALVEILDAGGGQRMADRDPITDWKAVKNPVEQAQIREVMGLDGAAMVAFHSWLRPLDGEAPAGSGWDEYGIGEKIKEFRLGTGARCRGESFEPIVALDSHSAMPHYTAKPVGSSGLGGERGWLLIDSGGQYLGGTTDMTRCFSLEPDFRARAEICHLYTIVLKGHLSLQRACFPRGTVGAQLDTLARAALWRERLDYQHGTGHGVGSYLSVHEGPASLSPYSRSETLEPGMILSNEPGYYWEGHFGIRIENLLLVREAEEEGWLYFEPLTLFPYERELIETELLSAPEVRQIDEYHQYCLRRLLETRLLRPEGENWLRRRCEPLGSGKTVL